ncbi:MAG: hypothetical protein K2P19_13605, partial [Kineothrix sp.]|nr:hypothetical protein [Kineothrix sp.]
SIWYQHTGKQSEWILLLPGTLDMVEIWSDTRTDMHYTLYILQKWKYHCISKQMPKLIRMTKASPTEGFWQRFCTVVFAQLFVRCARSHLRAGLLIPESYIKYSILNIPY